MCHRRAGRRTAAGPANTRRFQPTKTVSIEPKHKPARAPRDGRKFWVVRADEGFGRGKVCVCV